MSGPDQTPQMPDDRELEEFLAGRGKLRETYHAGAQEQPPAAVDDAILQMAAKAVAETPVAARKLRASRRWQPSLAAAAVLVLSFGVFFQVKKDPVAERAVFAPSADALTQEIATAQPAEVPVPSTAPSSAMELKKQKAIAIAEQAQRQKREMKEEAVEARRALAMAAPAPAAMAESESKSEADAGMAPLAKAAPEPERQGFALQDSAASKPAATPPPPPSMAMAGKMLRAAPAERTASVAAAPTVQAEPLAPMTESDLWLQTCSSDMAFNAPSRDKMVTLKTPQQWRGLSVVGFGAGALIFAPNVSREAVLERLSGLKDAAACLEPAQKDAAVRLLCRCVKP